MNPSEAAFPASWQAGAQLFAAGHWWEAHEAWEPEWLAATGERRCALQALILLAAALHKRWRMGSLTERNFAKAQVYLRGLPPGVFGVDWARLEQEVAACLRSDAPVPFGLPLLPVWLDGRPSASALPRSDE
ncbi:hypothetical protein GCM10017783_08540 [Deinococcus piscis]|uniref:DUF309 domain-containing protein n=1 Tax=Deinococcus piscis TaxID=394230 RepID=A0ABQ3K0T6_9DEIO|nr:DUF309 domain-containing protein [Deinococcus piscis]GHF98835.1 hypothetical protein GCM10017783_08540 [Deinococcus piscis]